MTAPSRTAVANDRSVLAGASALAPPWPMQVGRDPRLTAAIMNQPVHGG
jgi:hypothetical protein